MKVTSLNIHVFKNTENQKLMGMARVILDEELQLTGLRIYQGSSGLFVSYPNDPYYKGEDYRQIFYPMTRELRSHIEEEVIKEYNRVLEMD